MDYDGQPSEVNCLTTTMRIDYHCSRPTITMVSRLSLNWPNNLYASLTSTMVDRLQL